MRDFSMYAATGQTYRQNGDDLLVRDKRFQSHQPASRDAESLPIGELGSKAVYQVYATRFNAGTSDR
jgi:hypothetical protein